MTGSHHHDPIEENIETHPVKLGIGIAIGAVALIVGIIMVVQLAVSLYGSRSREGESTMTPQAVARRIAPVAQLAVDPNAPVAPAAVLATAPAAMPAVSIPPPAGRTAEAVGAGKTTYDAACSVCHATGVAGAPKHGDKAAWAPRIVTGVPALYNSSLRGKGAMPPKGGNTALSDDAVKAAVDYLLAAAK